MTSAGSTGGPPEGTIDVEGELIEVPPGWSGGVWFDFSDTYTFDPNAYQDDEYLFNNAPQSLFLLSEPFNPGLAVITVHTIIELAGGAYTERNFFRRLDASGPDALIQAVDCGNWNGLGAVFCVNSGSQGGGDGLFAIDASWEMTLVNPINNMNRIGFDPDGVFGGTNQPTLYYGTPTGLYEYPDLQLLGSSSQPRRITDDGRLAAILNGTGSQQLVAIEPPTDVVVLRTEATPPVPIARQNAGALRIVTGDTSLIEGVLYAVVQSSELHEFSEDGSDALVARSDPAQGWRWADAVVPEPDHELARDGRATFYVLESNRDLDRDRVIWLRGPSP